MVKHLCLLFCFALSLAGCDGLPFGCTPIGEIIGDPGQFDGQTVKVCGEVTEETKLPFLQLKSFTLRDSSGEILVQTTGVLPPLHEETTVRAEVKTVAIIDGKSFGLRLVEVE